MRKSLFIFILCFSFSVNASEQKVYFQEDSIYTYIANLQIGDSISYKIFLTSCLSGDRMETMETICFYKDSLNLNGLYKNKVYIIDSVKLNKVSKSELRILRIGDSSHSTSFYNYILEYENQAVLLGFGDKSPWLKLIESATQN